MNENQVNQNLETLPTGYEKLEIKRNIRLSLKEGYLVPNSISRFLIVSQ
jgi:hypothetical protein